MAIPAYQDYLGRAQTTQGIQLGVQVKGQVTEYVISKQEWPTSNADLGLGDVTGPGGASVVVQGQGNVVVTFSGKSRVIEGKTFVLQPYVEGEQLMWNCAGGSLPAKFRPPECRAQQ